jgi:transcriptional regulator with XRE-family HTH domain
MKTIRDLRQARGWTQFALALKVGVQPQAVYLWEQGHRLPKVVPMRKLGVVFGLCSDDIVLVSPDELNPPTQADGQPGESDLSLVRKNAAIEGGSLHATGPADT